MNTINYTKYTVEELLDVKRNIKSDSANYDSFIAEFGNRKEEIEEYYKSLEVASFAFAEDKVKVLGYFQIAASIIITLLILLSFFDGSGSLATTLIAVPIIALNAVCGYTLIKEMKSYYWLSILNQALQIPSFTLGNIHANYSSLGGIYIDISWADITTFSLSAPFSPGFSFQEVSGSFAVQNVSIDILAIVFIYLILKARAS